MKLAFIGQKGIPAVKGGGVEVYTEELATRLAKQGYEVFVYARKGYTGDLSARVLRKNRWSKYPMYKQVRVIYLPTIYKKNVEAIIHSLLATFHALTIKDLAIIHYQGIGSAPLALIPRLLKPSIKTVATFHSRDYMHKKWGLFARAYLRFAEWLALYIPHETITISRGLQTYVARKYNKDIDYIPQGLKSFEVPDETRYLSKYGLVKKRYILSVSRLVAHKGVHYLIDAYKHLPAEMKVKYKLAIVGSGSTSYTNDYEQYVHKLANGEPGIVFTGMLTGLPLRALYGNAYVFVQPSEDEGLSISLLEALGAGTAALVSEDRKSVV